MRTAEFVVISSLLVTAIVANVHHVSAYSPKIGDQFNYNEVITVDNGQGSYTGYEDQTRVTGMERMINASGSLVSTSYNYAYQFSSNQGGSNAGSKSGQYSWSSGSYTYINGTDNQVGYSKPIYVWFFMNPSLSVGAHFFTLNTRMTVLSKNFSFQLPGRNYSFALTIKAEGTGQYQRNDEYGVFTATYTWDEFFDPATGYIVGYNYVEHDTGQYQGQAGSFTYTDKLYVTTTTYPLTAASPPPTSFDYVGLATYLVLPAFVLIVIASVVLFIRRRRRRRETLPVHPPTPYSPPSPATTPWESKVDLGSKPSEQVVIREVAKVKCKYCGTLIPTTVDTCPYCGGPRQ